MIDETLLGDHRIDTPAEMEALGARIATDLVAGDLIILTGELGAGKTTLVRGLAGALGVRGPIQSPTFVIARTHPSLRGGPELVHADAYRLQSALELDDLDIDHDRAVTVVEWGRGRADHLRDEWWDIVIDRQLGGRGSDTMCNTLSRSSEMLDEDAPRTVRITHRSATDA